MSRYLSVSILFVLIFSNAVLGQGVTGQISGTVTDPGGSSIAGASVRLIHELSQQIREFTTEASGDFQFPNLVPGDYTVRIEHGGFKSYSQKSIKVSAEDRVTLGQLKLTVGEVSSTIQVIAESSRVSTETSDRSILIDRQQIEDTPISGRDYLGILRSLPGVQMVSTNDMPGWFNTENNLVNGGQSGQFVVTLDGIISQDSGAPRTGGYLAPNVDAIGEVKVLVSNYTAESGARAGGQMNVSIKNGTNQYHGSAYHFWRHEMLSANEFFNNKNVTIVNGVGVPVAKPRYRFQNPGATIGGPVIIPGLGFNKSRTRMFFFFSEDYLHTLTTGGVNSFNMPSGLERSGDFSQTVVKGGRRFSFSALIVSGDKKGKVGVGFGKANEVSEAIRKASDSARKSLVKVAVHNNTIPHEVIGEHGGGRVLLRPASPGTGVIAGGGVRAVVEAAGIRDVLAKSLGSSNHANVVKATIEALQQLRLRETILKTRGIAIRTVVANGAEN